MQTFVKLPDVVPFPVFTYVSGELTFTASLSNFGTGDYEFTIHYKSF